MGADLVLLTPYDTHAPEIDSRDSDVMGVASVATSLPWSSAPPNVLGVSCTAGPACRSRSGGAVAADEVRSTEWRIATAVTPSHAGENVGSSAAGPKPGRDSFTPKLGSPLEAATMNTQRPRTISIPASNNSVFARASLPTRSIRSVLSSVST